MLNGWTSERRRRQAELVTSWKPWELSTGPRSLEGKLHVARNAWRGCLRQMLRDLSKLVNKEVLLAQELLRRV